jgi:hypothetical protein
MGAPRKYPLELRERAVRLVFESGRPVRQDGVVSVARAQGQAVFPARFQLVATVTSQFFGVIRPVLRSASFRADEHSAGHDPQGPQSGAGHEYLLSPSGRARAARDHQAHPAHGLHRARTAARAALDARPGWFPQE